MIRASELVEATPQVLVAGCKGEDKWPRMDPSAGTRLQRSSASMPSAKDLRAFRDFPALMESPMPHMNSSGVHKTHRQTAAERTVERSPSLEGPHAFHRLASEGSSTRAPSWTAPSPQCVIPACPQFLLPSRCPQRQCLDILASGGARKAKFSFIWPPSTRGKRGRPRKHSVHVHHATRNTTPAFCIPSLR